MNPKSIISISNENGARVPLLHKLGTKCLWITIAVVSLLLLSANRSEASYKAVLGGITVSYSGYAAAYYNATNGTLTVEIDSNGGSLNISVGSGAYLDWGDYVDIYIVAGGSILKSISIKGTATCIPYVAGDVYYVDKFSLLNGVVGGTDYYGTSYGFGMNSPYVPAAISLKNSYALAQIFGYSNN